MENELRRLIALTEDKLTRKEYLEKTNRELSQELRIRQDIVKVRLEKIVSAHSENDEKNNEIKKYIKAEKRKEMIQTLLKIGIIKESMALALLAGEDKPGTAEDDAAFTVDGINIKSVLNIEID